MSFAPFQFQSAFTFAGWRRGRHAILVGLLLALAWQAPALATPTDLIICKMLGNNGDARNDSAQFSFLAGATGLLAPPAVFHTVSETPAPNVKCNSVPISLTGATGNLTVAQSATVTPTSGPSTWLPATGSYGWTVTDTGLGLGPSGVSGTTQTAFLTAAQFQAATGTLIFTFTEQRQRLITLCKIVEDNGVAPAGQGGTWNLTATSSGVAVTSTVSAIEGGSGACGVAGEIFSPTVAVTESLSGSGVPSAPGYPKISALQFDGGGTAVTASGSTAASVNLSTLVGDVTLTFTNKFPTTRTVRVCKAVEGSPAFTGGTFDINIPGVLAPPGFTVSNGGIVCDVRTYPISTTGLAWIERAVPANWTGFATGYPKWEMYLDNGVADRTGTPLAAGLNQGAGAPVSSASGGSVDLDLTAAGSNNIKLVFVNKMDNYGNGSQPNTGSIFKVCKEVEDDGVTPAYSATWTLGNAGNTGGFISTSNSSGAVAEGQRRCSLGLTREFLRRGGVFKLEETFMPIGWPGDALGYPKVEVWGSGGDTNPGPTAAPPPFIVTLAADLGRLSSWNAASWSLPTDFANTLLGLSPPGDYSVNYINRPAVTRKLKYCYRLEDNGIAPNNQTALGLTEGMPTGNCTTVDIPTHNPGDLYPTWQSRFAASTSSLLTGYGFVEFSETKADGTPGTCSGTLSAADANSLQPGVFGVLVGLTSNTFTTPSFVTDPTNPPNAFYTKAGSVPCTEQTVNVTFVVRPAPLVQVCKQVVDNGNGIAETSTFTLTDKVTPWAGAPSFSPTPTEGGPLVCSSVGFGSVAAINNHTITEGITSPAYAADLTPGYPKWELRGSGQSDATSPNGVAYGAVLTGLTGCPSGGCSGSLLGTTLTSPSITVVPDAGTPAGMAKVIANGNLTFIVYNRTKPNRFVNLCQQILNNADGFTQNATANFTGQLGTPSVLNPQAGLTQSVAVSEGAGVQCSSPVDITTLDALATRMQVNNSLTPSFVQVPGYPIWQVFDSSPSPVMVASGTGNVADFALSLVTTSDLKVVFTTLAPNVTLAKSGPAGPLAAGATVNYSITVSNTVTGTTAANYVFNEVVPANTTFVSVSGAGASTSCASGAVAGTLCPITVASVSNGTPVIVTFTVQVNATLPVGTTALVNQAYYVTPPLVCTLPSCNPNPPSGCSGGSPSICTPPPSCTAGDPACVTTPTVTPNVTLAKSGPAGPLAAGATVNYSITVSNTVTGTTAANYVFNEVVPANTTFVSVSGAGASTSCASGAVAGTLCPITVASVSNGTPVIVTFTVQVNATLPVGTTALVNQAYYVTPPLVCTLPSCNPNPPNGCSGGSPSICTPPPSCTAGDPACVTTPTVTPNVTLAKSGPAGPLAAGATVNYSITVSNTVTGTTAANYVFNEVVPANTTFVSVSGAGASTSCASGAVAGTLCPITVASVSNGTPVIVTFTVQVNATLPVGTTALVNQAYYVTPPLVCTLPSCNPNPPNGCSGGSPSICTPPPSCTAGDPACVTTPTVTPNVTLAKSGPAGPLAAGATVNYSITVSNTVTGTTAANYVFNEVVPANTTFVSVSGAGASTSCASGAVAGTLCPITVASVSNGTPVIVTFTVQVNATLPVGTTALVNQAYYVTPPLVCTLPSCNPNPPNGCSGGSPSICTPPPSCTAGDPACVTTPTVTPNVTLAKSGPAGPLAAGATVNYSITVSNTVTGTTAANYVFNEVVPANTTFVSVSGAGASTSCASGAVAGTLCPITVASVSNGTPVIVTFTVQVNATLPVGTTALVNQAYYVTPPLVCTLPSCNPNPPNGCSGGSPSICTPPPSCTAGDPACVTTPTVTPNVTLAKSGPAGPLAAGATVNYSITVSNTVTGTTAANYVFNEVVPANTTFVSVSGAGASTSCASGAVAGTLCPITVASVSNGTPVIVTFTVQVNATLPVGTTALVNQAYYVTPPLVCTLPSCNPNPPNGCSGGSPSICTPPPSCTAGDPACVTTPTVTPNVTLAKSGPAGPLAAGATVNYSITVSNTVTGTTAANYVFNEVVPANTTFVSVSGAGASTSCASGAVAGTLCPITVASVSNGTPVIVTFTVQVNATLPVGTTALVNQAYYVTPPLVCTLPSCNPNPPNGCSGGSPSICTPPPSCTAGDPACVTTPTVTPNVTLAKSGPAGPLAAGATVNYSITVSNTVTGTTAANYVFNEVVPANTTFVSVSGAGASTSCASGAVAGTLCPITVASVSNGTPVIVTFTVQVNATLPVGTTALVNQAYYVTPPLVCTLPSCNPNPPNGCSGGSPSICTPPPSCTAGDPACVTTPTATAPAIALDKSTAVTSVTGGMVIPYTLTLTNTGGSVQPAGFVFYEVVPANTTYSSVSGSITSSCAAGAVAGTLCMLTTTAPVAAAGGTLTVSFTVTAVTPIPAGTTNIYNALYRTLPTGCVGSTCPVPVCPDLATAACVTTPTVPSAEVEVPVNHILALWALMLLLIAVAGRALLRSRPANVPK